MMLDNNIARLEASRVPARERKTNRITVSLSEGHHAELSELAAEADVSLSWLTRHAIGELLKRYRKGQLQFALPLAARGEKDDN